MCTTKSTTDSPTSPAVPPVQPRRLSLGAFAGLSFSMLMSSLDTSIANAGLPTLAQSLSATFQNAQWVVLAYLLAITTLIVSVGRMGDIVGPRRLLLVGILSFTLASALCGVAPTLGFLIAARAAQGVGAAIMMALSVALIGQIVPRNKTGSAMGLLGTMSAIGTSLGPSIGGLLITSLGWRAMFLVNVPLGAITMYLAYRHIPRDRPNAKASWMQIDRRGTFVLALTLAAYALAMTNSDGNLTTRTAPLLLIALLGLVVFLFVEATATSPLVNLSLFRNPALSASLATSTLVSTVIMATLVVGPFYLTHALRLQPMQVGFALSVGPLAAAVCGVPAGRIVDHFGSRRMTLIGLIGMSFGTLSLCMLPVRFGVVGYISSIAVVTANYAVFQVANNTALMEHVQSHHRGVLSGLLTLSRNLGLITGASVMGSVFAFASAGPAPAYSDPAAIATGMHATFAVATAFLLAAITAATVGSILAKRSTVSQGKRLESEVTTTLTSE